VSPRPRDRREGAGGKRDLASLPRGSSWLVTMNAVAEAACLLGDEDAAGEAYDLLLPFADLPLVGAVRGWNGMARHGPPSSCNPADLVAPRRHAPAIRRREGR